MDILNMTALEIGKAIKVNDGKKVAIFSTGAIFDEVDEACKALSEEGIVPTVYTFPTVKPIDKDVILECASKYGTIITVEEWKEMLIAAAQKGERK